LVLTLETPAVCGLVLRRPRGKTRVSHWGDTTADARGCSLQATTEEPAMSSTQVGSETTGTRSVGTVDLKLSVVVIPVADVDRSKSFYESLGWRLDADFPFENGFRVVALRRVAAAHGEHEMRNGGKFDENWPDWYAAYLVAEQAGTELPT